MSKKLGEVLRAQPGPILVTGHTGFKGTWLMLLLEELGISATGIALPPEKDSLFIRAGLDQTHKGTYLDIRREFEVRKFISELKPSVIFHLAAQPLVLESYQDPHGTFETNVLGTLNILDSAYKLMSPISVQVITTDKVYKNDNNSKAFVETDSLKGKDPYSASKVACEAVVDGYMQMHVKNSNLLVGSVRAGNVIGGGDWSKDRLLPDLIRGFKNGEKVRIRNGSSTRPWQHVLDPLVGYVMAMEYQIENQIQTSFNFGPKEAAFPVSKVSEISKITWGDSASVEIEESSGADLESEFLELNSDLASNRLGWMPQINQISAIETTVRWWKEYFRDESSARELVKKEISDYIEMVVES